MSAITWRDEAARWLFAEAGLRGLRDFLDCRLGTQVTQARTRMLRRFDLGEETWYLKLQDLRGQQLPWRRIPSYVFKGSPVAREAASLDRLKSLGILVPEMVAWGQGRSLLPWGAMLLTRALPGYLDLVAWLETRPPTQQARIVLGRVGTLVRDLHEKGLVLAGCKYRNILVDAGSPESPLALIDQPDLRSGRSTRLRNKDLQLLEFDRSRYADWIRAEEAR